MGEVSADKNLVPNDLGTEALPEGSAEATYHNFCLVRPLGMSGLPPDLCLFPKGCSGGQASGCQGRSLKHRRVHFQKQICLLTGKAATETERTRDFFFTNRPLTLVVSKGSHSPWQACSCYDAKASGAGREHILTGCSRLEAGVQRAMVEHKPGGVPRK